MPMHILFWMLMILWLVFWLVPLVTSPVPSDNRLGWLLPVGGQVLLFIIVALLGVQVFGAALK